MKYTTKDSGKRQDYESGMRRDIQEGKVFNGNDNI